MEVKERASQQVVVPSHLQSSIAAYWTVQADAELGVDYSYGCEGEEISGIYKYPNTSCVDDLMNPTVYHTKEQCEGGKCAGLEVFRIYWQKNADNLWSADQDDIAYQPEENKAYVEYLDWGDALEAVSWTERSRVRVETQPYSSTILDYTRDAVMCGSGWSILRLTSARWASRCGTSPARGLPSTGVCVPAKQGSPTTTIRRSRLSRPTAQC